MDKSCCSCPVGKTAMVLIWVGALNWGLVGAFGFDLVDFIFVELLNVAVLAKIVYIVVGLSAVWVAIKKWFA